MEQQSQNTNQEQMNPSLKFGELRKYFAHHDNISICMRKTLEYENFQARESIPHSYDDLYVYGVGLNDEVFPDRFDKEAKATYQACLEIILDDEPRF